MLSPLERINRDLAAILFGEEVRIPEKPLDMPTSDYQLDYGKYAGTFEAFMPIPVSVERGRLYISIYGFKLELFPVSDTVEKTDFYAKAAYVQVSFHKNESGEAVGATIRWLGEDGYDAARKS